MPSAFAILSSFLSASQCEKRPVLTLSLIVVFLLAGCAQPVVAISDTLNLEPIPATAKPLELENTAVIRPETMLAAAQSVKKMAPVLALTSQPEDGPIQGGQWSLFSDPNFIQDIAVVDDQLWAATLGGVVVWNLQNDQPRLYTNEDGLAEIQALAVSYCPSSDQERIFIGHESGVISVFDLKTKEWSTISPGEPNGLTESPIESLYCDLSHNRLLAGGPGGIDFLNLGSSQWIHIGAKQGMTARTVKDMVVYDRTTWVAAGRQGGFLINDQRAVALNYLDHYPTGEIDDVAVSADGGFWFVRPAGLALFWSLDRSVITYGSQNVAGVPFTKVDHLEISPDGRVWIGGSSEGACPFEPKKRFCSTFYTNPEGYSMTVIRAGRNLTAYMGTNGGGILVLLPDGVRRLVYPSQISGSQVTSLVEAAGGVLWAASNRGANWFDLSKQEEGWHLLEAGQGSLASEHVRGIRSFEGRLWAFYDDSPEVSFLEDETWNSLPGPLPWQQVWDIRLDASGYLWIASDKGIFSWDGISLQPFKPAASLLLEIGSTLFPDGDTLWVGTPHGLWECRDPNCNATNVKGRIYQILPEQDGGLLLGTEDGLLRYTGGLGSPVMITVDSMTAIWPEVTALALDLDQNLWVGTRADGVFIQSGGQWQQVMAGASTLPAGNILSIMVDHLGSVWIAVGNQLGGGALVRYIPAP